MALRSAKYAAANMIPVVGNVVSGALGTLTSGVKMLTGTVGALSAASVVYVAASPLVSLLLARVALVTGSAICGFSGADFGRGFFESVKGAVDALISVTVFSSLIYILEIIVLMTVVRGSAV